MWRINLFQSPSLDHKSLESQKNLDQKIKILDFQYIKRTSSIKKFLQSKRLWFFFLLSLRWIKNSDLDCNHKIMITQLQQQNVQKFKDLKFVSWTHQSKRIENYESSSQHQYNFQKEATNASHHKITTNPLQESIKNYYMFMSIRTRSKLLSFSHQHILQHDTFDQRNGWDFGQTWTIGIVDVWAPTSGVDMVDGQNTMFANILFNL